MFCFFWAGAGTVKAQNIVNDEMAQHKANVRSIMETVTACLAVAYGGNSADDIETYMDGEWSYNTATKEYTIPYVGQ